MINKSISQIGEVEVMVRGTVVEEDGEISNKHFEEHINDLIISGGIYCMGGQGDRGTGGQGDRGTGGQGDRGTGGQGDRGTGGHGDRGGGITLITIILSW